MAQYEGDEYALGHDGPSDSASEDEPPSRSQAFRRPALGKRPALRKLSSDGDAEDDGDDSSNGYLPFAAGTASTTKQDIHHQESATTLKSSPKRQTARPAFQPHQTLNKGKSKAPLPPPSSSEEDPSSSATSSSAAHPPASSRFELAQDRSSGPMNPAHRAHLASLSPRARQAAALSDASPSEGGRSMGSSFSDLEDDSITRSAMESALAEHLRDHGSLTQGVGSIASRMGSMGRNLGSGFGGGGRR
ncbi:hypothetical protein B0A50_05475 [Salinomyces thailandicus]|uniref:Uncharacterized protein n=1 Tax=Salinomyces thailandicus TaxID=706561 RepID=A0A4U0TUF2_9PEZI|nr:hypothetical protein B0A50_05475 [Salinomyces thailandica]